ncbi:MAG: HAD family hydrolase [Sphingobacterium sp.]|uniref:HAD family hydrolase n=1 Tax=Sphingobacterium sp. JB170 TaxID=1434842 RepID=UPI00097EDD97|nr:HAD family phosphatase [Sphingobacterium sp. JB170]SJN36505.1 Haloacid dehalogenase-like hydrolase [Sphingobacterium sp. JB170]
MQKIKNIILDYGNVIFMIDFDRVQESFRRLGIKNIDDFFGHRTQNPLFDEFDRGEITASEFRARIRHIVGDSSLTDAAIDEAWNSLLVGVPPGRHGMLEYLHDKYRTFLLSNNNVIHYSYCMGHIREVYGVESNEHFFEKTYYSHKVGLRKPDKAIFQLLIDENNIVPEQTLFIDDSPQHLDKAMELGFQTALCTTEEPLELLIEKFSL